MNILFVLNLCSAIFASTVLIYKKEWLLSAVAIMSVTLYGYGLLVHGVPSDDTLTYMLYCEERYTPEKAMASSYGAIVSLIMTSFMMSTYPWLKHRSLFLWFGLLIVIGVITGIMSPLGVFEGLYGICCAIMTFLAQMTGLTFIQVCCIENIYIHSLLPTLFAIPAALIGFKNIANGRYTSFCATGLAAINLLICLFITLFIWNHYIHLSIPEAASLCVCELQMIGRMLLGRGWAGYVLVNMIIYIGAFLLIAFVSWLLYRWTKHYEKYEK